MAQPEISVIMPVYNGGKWLDAAVESVLSQAFRNLELLLVDDGSDDGSAARCDALAHQDDRVRVIHQENAGISAARNAGLEAAKSEYVAFCDDDDCYMPGYLAAAYDYAQQCRADLVRMDFRLLRERKNGDMKQMTHEVGIRTVLKAGDGGMAYDEFLRGAGPLFVWNALYRRKAIGRIRFDCSCRCGLEDFIFNARFHAGMHTAVYAPRLAYLHYERPQGTSTQLDQNTLQSRLQSVKPWMEAEFAAASAWCSDSELTSVWSERKTAAITFLMHQLRDSGAENATCKRAWMNLHAVLRSLRTERLFDFMALAGHNKKQMAALLLYQCNCQGLYPYLRKEGIDE
jgi:glycosyltransferase involved in cell wall biosynthesis